MLQRTDNDITIEGVRALGDALMVNTTLAALKLKCTSKQSDEQREGDKEKIEQLLKLTMMVRKF